MLAPTVFGVLLLLTASGALGASNAASTGSGPLESATGAWFVQLNGSAEAFNAKAKASGLSYTERFRFNKLWNGVSVNADADTAAAMRTIDGVVAVSPVGVVALDPVATADPELAHAITMTGADVAQNELGLTGKGVTVGVMDTGIDYNNPALGGCFGAACRVQTGWDFVGDRFDASGSGGALIPHPDADPDDCQGHGTHVAGIVGANGTVNGRAIKGVAPGATLNAYRVFGCDGSTSDDIMIAAFERAVSDGVDVLNLSIGDAFAWPTDPVAQAANAAVAAGVIVVLSAGNSGTNGLYSLSSAGNAKDVIGVASLDNTHVELRTFTAAPDARSVGYVQAAAAPDAPTSGTMALTRIGTTTTVDDGCAALPAGSLAGKAVLIRRGTCTFFQKALNAQNAGAVGVVLYNNNPPNVGLFSPTVAGATPITIPVVAISDSDGAVLVGRIPTALTSTVEITWTDQLGTFPNPTSGQPSSFTSWGLTPTLDLKPDMAAPGGLIISTYPLEKGGFTTLSGTSMAAPHVSGAAALYLEAHPGTTPAQMRNVLQNTAEPVPFNASFAQATHRVGAGLIKIDKAVEATAGVTPAKLALGEGTAAQTQTVTIANHGSAAVTYNLSEQRAVGTSASTFAPGAVGNFATVTFSSPTVTVPAGGTATVDVTIAPLIVTGTDRTIYTGYVRLTPQGGGQILRVPYAGFTGDYQSITVLAPGACSFPGVFKAGGQTTCGSGTNPPTLPGWTRQAAAATYNVEDSKDRPILLYHLAHQSQRIEIRAVNASGQEFLVARTDLAERNPTNDLTPPGQATGPGFFTYRWDGKAVFTNAKNGTVNRRALDAGTYKLRLVVTKALAEAGNPAHTETWDSPAMNIVRTG